MTFIILFASGGVGFSSVRHRPTLAPMFNDTFTAAFVKFAVEVKTIHATYDQHNADPPRPRHKPRISGSISWARHLLRRLTEPMEGFTANAPGVLESTEARGTIKHYNNVATALIKYEQLWVRKFHAHARHARKNLSATVLVRRCATNCATAQLYSMASGGVAATWLRGC